MQHKYFLVSPEHPSSTFALKYDAKFGQLRISAPNALRHVLDELKKTEKALRRRVRVRNSGRYALGGYADYKTATNFLVTLKEAGWDVRPTSDLGGL